MDVENLITTAQAAEMLGVCQERVRWFCATGRIKAQQVCGCWVMDRDAVKALVRAPIGRPPKVNPNEAQQAVTAAMDQVRDSKP